MKKIYLIFFLATVLLIPLSVLAQAQGWCASSSVNPCCDDSNAGGSGFVPCGRGQPVGGNFCRCELYHVFFLALNVYKFVVWAIAIPLAGLFLMIGGILLLVSGGGSAPIPGVAQGPSLYNTGKKIIMGAIGGLALILGSWVIINIVMVAIGYQGGWWVF